MRQPQAKKEREDRLRLRPWFGLFAVAALFAGACTQTPPPMDRTSRLQHMLGASVQLFTSRNGESQRAGSGVVLADDGDRTLILTTAHLIEPLMDQVVHVVTLARPEERIPARIVALDAENDLLLVDVEGIDPAAVELAGETTLTDEVWVVGFPWGKTQTIVRGVVSRVEIAQEGSADIPVAGPVVLIDAPVRYGMSGGGVFAAESGRLVGIVRGYRTARLQLASELAPVELPLAGETTVIPAAQIRAFLDTVGMAEMRTAGQFLRADLVRTTD